MNPADPRSLFTSIHYGWFIVGAGTLCIFAGLGFGRFALGMLLPSMGRGLELTYSQMGLISTANFIGYLLAVLISGKMTARFGARLVITGALFMAGASMMAVGASGGLFAITLLYAVTGMGSGLSNVPMMGLISAWFTSRTRGRATGFVVIGSGFAIIISGRLIPWLTQSGTDGWRSGWFLLGTGVTLAALICWLILRNRPQELGLQPVGGSGVSSQHGLAPPPVSSRTLFHCAVIYFLFGFTYVIYVTFIVTALVNERGFSENTAGLFWSWVGVLSLFSGPVFGTLSDRHGRKGALTLVFAIQTLSYLLIAANLPGPALYLSIGSFGLVAWSIPSIMAALIGDYVGPQRAVSVFGFITFVFAIGQISGPYLAGLLAERSGSFSGSFYLAAGLALSAAGLSARLPMPAQTGPQPVKQYADCTPAKK
ncbi:MAG: YbfB/YjiJ family MFS transporter [Thermodesulfobacteriota bacterium]